MVPTTQSGSRKLCPEFEVGGISASTFPLLLPFFPWEIIGTTAWQVEFNRPRGKSETAFFPFQGSKWVGMVEPAQEKW